MWLDHTSRIRAYLVAVGLVAACIAIKLWVLVPLVDGASIVVPFLLPVTLAAWYGGGGPGLAALAFSAMAESLLLLPAGWPQGHLLADHIRVWFLVGEGLLVCTLVSRLKVEEQRSWSIAERLAKRQTEWTPKERRKAQQQGRPEMHLRDEDEA